MYRVWTIAIGYFCMRQSLIVPKALNALLQLQT